MTSVMEELTDTATMIERDKNVAAVWRTILGRSGRRLAERILSFKFTETNVRAVVQTTPESTFELAFQTIVRNRVNHNGVIAPTAGMLKEGEEGYGISSRWYPETIAKRIMDIIEVKNRITIKEADGLRYIKKRANHDRVVYFIDPPYCDVGRRLYLHGEINHRKLFQHTMALEGDFLMTYSHTEEVLRLADKHNFETQVIWMSGDPANAKTELLIGRNLDWISTASNASNGSLQLALEDDTNQENGYRLSNATDVD